MLDKLLSSQLTAAEMDRASLYAKAIEYYEGLGPSRILITKPGDPDDNLAITYAPTIVDKGVSFLFGGDLDIEIGSESDESSPAEDYLDLAWPEENRAIDFIELATSGGIFGHAWAKIAIDEAGRPGVIILDPQNMSAFWNPRNYREILRYRNQYNTSDENGNPIIWREDTERVSASAWVIRESYSRPDQKNWIPAGPPIEWPYPFAPVFECKNLPKPSEFYGKADLNRGVLSLIHYLARVDSLINRIIRVHAYPKPVAKGMREQDLKVGVDSIIFLPQIEQSLELLEMSGDLIAIQNFRRTLREALAEISHVPEIATGKVESIGQLSGLALKILYGPLLDRTYIKQLLYGRLIRNLVQALLTLGNYPGLEISLNWPAPLPGDEKANLEAAIMKGQIGVSSDTVLRELGYDPSDEAEKASASGDMLSEKLIQAFNRGN